MGIDINCLDCSQIEDKQVFSSRRRLLDALRLYLKDNKEKHEKELKYVNWFYRDIDGDKEKVLNMTEEEKKDAQRLLRENKLDGLFVWTFLEQEDFISYVDAKKFLDTYSIIKKYLKEPFLNLSTIIHAATRKHNLECW